MTRELRDRKRIARPKDVYLDAVNPDTGLTNAAEARELLENDDLAEEQRIKRARLAIYARSGVLNTIASTAASAAESGEALLPEHIRASLGVLATVPWIGASHLFLLDAAIKIMVDAPPAAVTASAAAAIGAASDAATSHADDAVTLMSQAASAAAAEVESYGPPPPPAHPRLIMNALASAITSGSALAPIAAASAADTVAAADGVTRAPNNDNDT